MDKQLISQEDTFVWLSRVGLKGETGSEITAAKDQVLQTKYNAQNFTKRNKDKMQTLGTIL